MPTTRATVNLAYGGSVANDGVVNVFHFDHVGDLTETSATGIKNALLLLYNAVGPYWSISVNDTAGDPHEVLLATLEAGGPGREDDIVSRITHRFVWSLTSTGGTTALPPECAVALSYRGDLTGAPEEAEGNIRPASRRRGRTFLGPFATTTVDITSPNIAKVHQNLVDVILIGYVNMIAALQALPQPVTHVIYSPTNGSTVPVTLAWVDNAWDTIRSRGQDATARTEEIIDQTP